MRRDFGWRPSERKHGKGAKRMQRRTLNFRLLYANVHMKDKVRKEGSRKHGIKHGPDLRADAMQSERRKTELKEEERKRFQAKLCAFVRKVSHPDAPFVRGEGTYEEVDDHQITPFVVEVMLAEYGKKSDDFIKFKVDQIQKQAPIWRACEHPEVKYEIFPSYSIRAER